MVQGNWKLEKGKELKMASHVLMKLHYPLILRLNVLHLSNGASDNVEKKKQ